MANFLFKYFIFSLCVYMFESMLCALRVQMLDPGQGVIACFMLADISTGAVFWLRSALELRLVFLEQYLLLTTE